MTDKSKELTASIRLLNEKLHFEGVVDGNEPVSIDYTAARRQPGLYFTRIIAFKPFVLRGQRNTYLSPKDAENHYRMRYFRQRNAERGTPYLFQNHRTIHKSFVARYNSGGFKQSAETLRGNLLPGLGYVERQC